MVFGPVPEVGWLGAAGWLAVVGRGLQGLGRWWSGEGRLAGSGWVWLALAGSRVAVVGVAVAGGGWVRVAGSWPVVVGGVAGFRAGAGLREIHLEPESPF